MNRSKRSILVPAYEFIDFMKYVMVFLRLTGQQTFLLLRHPKEKRFYVKFMWFDVILLVLTCTSSVWFSIRNMEYHFVFNMTNSPITNLGLFVMSCCIISLCLLCPLINFLNRDKFAKLYNLITLIDEDVSFDIRNRSNS